MELLIPGLILVALMAYVSTRIKKRAAAAFEPELVETEEYSISKPEGFLHVLNSDNHSFEAYSKEFGEDDDSRTRRATIEVDVFPGGDLRSRYEALGGWLEIDDSERSCLIETDETANESALKVVYKMVAGENSLYQLRFAVLDKHMDEYSDRIDETLESFKIKTS